MSREEKLERALKVMLLTPHIRRYLDANDPKAVQQAEAAIKYWGPEETDPTCDECGQGPKGAPAREHKSSCSLYVDYNGFPHFGWAEESEEV